MAAHCGLAAPAAWLEMEAFAHTWMAAEWREFLGRRGAEEENEAIRRNTHTGRPLGAPEFVERLEATLGRWLAPRKGGRPRKEAVDERQEALSFGGGG